jgi:cell cycle arrest protein BUB2
MVKPQPSWALGVPGPDAPASPRTMRTLRKIQSHQVLSTSSALIAQTQTSHQADFNRAGPEPATNPGAATRARGHRRARSNSDAAAREAAATQPATQRRPARKTGSGIGIKRSLLDNLLRDGPQSANLHEGLRELKYLVLSSRVDADGDGMVRRPEICFETGKLTN